MLQELSPRERDVMWLVADGLLNKQIALSLRLKESTVKGHVEEILRKLEAINRTDAAGKWRDLGRERPGA